MSNVLIILTVDVTAFAVMCPAPYHKDKQSINRAQNVDISDKKTITHP